MDITVNELKERIDNGTAPIMIDVREPFEWQMDHLPQVEKISLRDLANPTTLDKMAGRKEMEIVLICRSGGRSGRATNFLKSKGFVKARNLKGGMLAWKTYIDPKFNVM